MIRVWQQSRSSLCPRFPARLKSLVWSRVSRHNRRRRRNKKNKWSQRPKEGDLKAESRHQNANPSAKNLSTSPERMSRRKKVLAILFSSWFLKTILIIEAGVNLKHICPHYGCFIGFILYVICQVLLSRSTLCFITMIYRLLLPHASCFFFIIAVIRKTEITKTQSPIKRAPVKPAVRQTRPTQHHSCPRRRPTGLSHRWCFQHDDHLNIVSHYNFTVLPLLSWFCMVDVPLCFIGYICLLLVICDFVS